MKQLKISVVAFNIIICICYNLAYTQSIHTLTLESSINLALTNNLQLANSEISLKSNINTLETSKASRFPSVNGNAGQSYSLGRNIDPATNQFITRQNLSNNFSLSSSIQLFNGFKVSNNIKQGEANIRAQNYDQTDLRSTVISNTIASYIQVLYAKSLLKVAETQYNYSTNQLSRLESLVKIGNSPESDLLELMLKNYSDELYIEEVKGQYKLSKLILLQSINPNSYDVLDLDSIQIEDIVTDSISEINPVEINELVNTATKTHPTIRSSNEKYKISELSLIQQRNSRFPTLNASSSLSTIYSDARKKIVAPTFEPRDYPFLNQLYDNLSFGMSVNLSIPIYGNRRYSSAIQNAVLNLEKSKINLKETKITIRKKIEQAGIEALTTLNKRKIAKLQLESAKKTYHIIESKYNAGIISTIEFIMAINNLNKAENDFLRAKYEYYLKYKILEIIKKDINI